MENNALFRDDIECQKLIMEAMKYHLLPERRPMLQSPRTKPRKSTVGMLFAVGGMDATKGNHSLSPCKVSAVKQILIWCNIEYQVLTCLYEESPSASNQVNKSYIWNTDAAKIKSNQYVL